MEQNELNKNAKGGTELMGDRLREHVSSDLLDQFQIISSRVRDLDSNKKKILWCHDLAMDPEVQHLKDGGWKKFDKIVFVSHWQQAMYNAYLGVPYSAGVVLKNAIKPIDVHQKPSDKIRLIYFSTPHRGLDLLYPAFNQLATEFDNIELNVFSSFSLYGWPQRDEPYKDLFKRLEDHPHINYHGSVSNDEIRKELMRSHILAYPSKWQETSCLCLIEAMSAGLACVHSSLAALPETSMNLTQMYSYNEDPTAHVNIFYAHLKHVITMLLDKNAKRSTAQNLHVMKQLTDSVYNWNHRGQEWEILLKNLLTSR